MKQTSHHPNRLPHAGFTLVELLITTSIASLVLFASYLCLRAGLITQKEIEARSDAIQSARVAMERIARDLRSATPLSPDYEFIGLSRTVGEMEADNLDFATRYFQPLRPGESDFCEVSYFIALNEDSGTYSLWRRIDGTRDPEPLSGGYREEIAQGISGLKFEYYDGFDWYDSWGSTEEKEGDEDDLYYNPNLYGLPEAVRITLTFDVHPKKVSLESFPAPRTLEDENPPENLKFQTVVHLNLATTSWNSSYGAQTSSGTTGNQE